MTNRFKIDLTGSSIMVFGLYFKKGGWFDKWELVNCFESKDEARALYERVKDLPEYLS